MSRRRDARVLVRQAMSGRRGPVSVDLPINLQYFDAEAEIPPIGAVPEPDARAVAQAAEMLANARRPLIWAGGGVIAAGADAELTALAEARSVGGPALLDLDLNAIGPMPVKYGGVSRRPTR